MGGIRTSLREVSRGVLSLLGFLLLIFLPNCGQTSAPIIPELVIPEFHLQNCTANMTAGESITLNAVIDAGDNLNIGFATSSPNIVSVTSLGGVFAFQEGIATVTAFVVSDPIINHSCRIVVSPVPLSEIPLLEGEISMVQGDQLALSSLIPTEHASEDFIWESSDPTVLEVLDSFDLLAKVPGMVTMSVQYLGPPVLNATFRVEVTPIPVSSISLDPSQLTLEPGQTGRLTPIVLPFGSPKEVNWESSDDNIVSVADGVVSALRLGTVTITATSVVFTDKMGQAQVTVTAPPDVDPEPEPDPDPPPDPEPEPPPAVADVTLTVSKLTLIEGEDLPLDITVLPQDADQSVTIESSDPTVLTISDGVAKALFSGTATLTARSVSDPTQVSQVTIQVIALVSDVDIQSGDVELEVGDFKDIQAMALPARAAQDISWESSDPTVAEVVEGRITAIAPGLTQIKVRSLEDQTIVESIDVTVYVVATSVTLPVPADKAFSDPDFEFLLATGEGVQLVATVSPAQASQAVSWISSDDTVLTVSNGTVTAVGPGLATIEAVSHHNTTLPASASIAPTDQLKMASLTGRVYDTISTLSLTDVPKIIVGESQGLTLNIAPADPEPGVVWESADSSIVSVDQSGTITAVSYGTTSVTAQAPFQSDLSATSTVAVFDEIQAISVASSDVLIPVGATFFVDAQPNPTTAYLEPLFHSSSLSVATVDTNGLVTAIRTGKTFVTTYIALDNPILGETIVEVYQPIQTLSVSGADTIAIGETVQLTATKGPAFATGNVTWSSADSSIVSVDAATGEITGISVGTADITVMSDETPSVVGVKTIRVESPLSGLTLTPSSNKLKIGGSLQLTAVVNPTNYSQDVTWESLNPDVIQVDSSGLVTGISEGQGQIRAVSIFDGVTTQTADFTVRQAPTSISIVGLDSTIRNLQWDDFLIDIQPADANQDVGLDFDFDILSIGQAAPLGAIPTTNPDAYYATAKNLGTTTITIHAVYDENVVATTTISVISQVDQFLVSPNMVTINTNASFTYETVVDPPTYTSIFQWSSDSPSVATIDQFGKLTAISPGTAVITAQDFFDPTIIATASVVVELPQVNYGPVIYVNGSATGDNNGLDWTHAFTSLQSALQVSTAGKEIWVAEGTYSPGNSRTDSFELNENVTVIGGFLGHETSSSQVNPANYTILDGDIGVDGDHTDNSYNVLKPASNVTFKNFIIQNGNANGGRGFQNGGAINLGASITNLVFDNCIFRANQASSLGGAIYSNSSYTIKNSRFENNHALQGGAIYSSFNGGTVQNTVFDNNSATGNGGALLMSFTSVQFSSTTMSNNSAANGGAIFSENFFHPFVTGVTFSNNTPNDYGQSSFSFGF